MASQQPPDRWTITRWTGDLVVGLVYITVAPVLVFLSSHFGMEPSRVRGRRSVESVLVLLGFFPERVVSQPWVWCGRLVLLVGVAVFCLVRRRPIQTGEVAA